MQIRKEDLEYFKTLKTIENPSFLKTLVRSTVIFLIILALMLLFTPWQQNSQGYGYVTNINPADRLQDINATVSGSIKQWYVQEMSFVNKGDKIAKIVDIDPQIIERLSAERNALKRKADVVTIASKTALLDYERQEDLFKKGLSSKREFEKAKIEYKKLLSSKESALAELAIIQTKFARQNSQIIKAPNNGVIFDILSGDSSTFVQVGDKIARFAPNLEKPIVELYIDSNDAGLIKPGRKVRLQFQGLPAIQFGGWPSLSVGTFKGVVKSVDKFVSKNGKFRIIIEQDIDEQWPVQDFLRHGLKVHGWVLLDNVKLGYEIWRKINNFPPNFDLNANQENSYLAN